MGLGDDVMAVGRAARMHSLSGRKVVIGPPGARYWSRAFENAPFLVQPDEPEGDAERLRDYPGCRRYINYQASNGGRQVLVPTHRPKPGMLFFSPLENEIAQHWLAESIVDPGFVLVEPHVKGTFSGQNKAWPWDHWVELVQALKAHDHTVVQASAPGNEVLPDVDATVMHGDPRRALAVMRYARAIVTTDGLFHHAAAALGVPAVVIWGDRTDPRILGYDDHTNLTSGTNRWCGSMKAPCQHCADAMRSIRPERVWLAVDKLTCQPIE